MAGGFAGWRTDGAAFGHRFTAQSLLRTLLIYLSEDCSMREAAQRVRHGELAQISGVGLLKRMNKSAAWLSLICARLIEESSPASMQCPVLQGRRMLAIDGSVVTELGATGST
ncbi:hypothetical protein KQH49_07950 [Mycetohabitans sp. B5]|uniref:Uncharacterized protein n=1 Tax=Mycetohabitans endofungorum TaxID=417203 RepID=A0A2P5KAU4_9BURK|nr:MULTISPECIES: hypothetical protein [Mycetohabitans]MCG1054886.1 hypothetical protein [Mycetohabitans sp. B5]PPB83817.1 hypothetical protein B0O95_106208 [Mycetohabitans endofungorum]